MFRGDGERFIVHHSEKMDPSAPFVSFKPCHFGWSIGHGPHSFPHLQLCSVLPPPSSSSPLLTSCCPYVLLQISLSFRCWAIWSAWRPKMVCGLVYTPLWIPANYFRCFRAFFISLNAVLMLFALEANVSTEHWLPSRKLTNTVLVIVLSYMY